MLGAIVRYAGAPVWVVLALGVKVDDEVSAFALFAFDGDCASVGDDDLSANAQTQAHTLSVLLSRLIKLTEIVKEFLQVSLCDAHPCVSEDHLELQACTYEFRVVLFGIFSKCFVVVGVEDLLVGS